MNRKELVKALEAKWGVRARYLGVPSCAYEITGAEGVFRIDRQGAIRNQDGRECTAEELLSQPRQAEPMIETEPRQPQIEGYAVTLPLEGHTAESLRNWVNMLASKQRLILSAFGLSQPMLDISFAEELHQRPIEDLETFQTVWTEAEARRSPGFELDFAKQRLALKLLKEHPPEEERAAFHDLAVCMNENAKKLKFSSFKPAQEENPKFAFRTWLLRLGMNGGDYKTTRKVLLERLSGSAAFRTAESQAIYKERLVAKKAGQL